MGLLGIVNWFRPRCPECGRRGLRAVLKCSTPEVEQQENRRHDSLKPRIATRPLWWCCVHCEAKFRFSFSDEIYITVTDEGWLSTPETDHAGAFEPELLTRSTELANVDFDEPFGPDTQTRQLKYPYTKLYPDLRFFPDAKAQRAMLKQLGDPLASSSFMRNISVLGGVCGLCCVSALGWVGVLPGWSLVAIRCVYLLSFMLLGAWILLKPHVSASGEFYGKQIRFELWRRGLEICVECGYNLQHSAPPCPECGASSPQITMVQEQPDINLDNAKKRSVYA